MITSSYTSTPVQHSFKLTNIEVNTNYIHEVRLVQNVASLCRASYGERASDTSEGHLSDLSFANTQSR